jgi:alkylhydroperoxidase/carboxymuconolactone decarboxylase family protein YurZ
MISLTQDLNQQFTEFATKALESSNFSERERALVVIAVAIAMEDNNSVKQAVVAAKQMGVGNEEIGQISAMVIAMRGLKIANLGLVTPTANSQTSQSNCCR